MFESISAVANSAGYLLEGVGVTLVLVGLSLFIGFVCGIILTLGQGIRTEVCQVFCRRICLVLPGAVGKVPKGH